MSTYEVLVVFKPFIDIESNDSAMKPLEKALKNAEGEISKKDIMGRKRLAYEIDNFKDGYLVNFLMELPGDGVDKFRKACQMNDDILRLTLLKMDEVSLASLSKPREKGRR